MRSFTMHVLNEKWVIILNVLISLTLLIFTGTINYFEAANLAAANSISSTGHIPSELYVTNGFWFNNANTLLQYPGASILQSMLSAVTDIPNFSFAYPPIIALFWVLIILCFTKLFSGKNMWLFLFLSLSLNIYTLSMFPHIWTLSYHSLGYLFFLLFLYLCLRLLLLSGGRGKYVFLIFLSFAASLMTYYTASMFSVAFIFSLAVITWIIFKRNELGLPIYFLVALLIAYLTFDAVFFTILHIWQLDFGGLFNSLINSTYNFLIGKPTSDELFAFGNPITVSVIDVWLNRCYLVFTFVYPILILTMLLINKTGRLSKQLVCFVLAALTITLFESISYAVLTKAINLRFLTFYVPVVTITVTGFIVSKYNSYKKAKKVIALVCIVFILIATVSSVKLNLVNTSIDGLGYNRRSLIGYSEYAAIISYASNDVTIYSNFQVSGELRMVSLELGDDNIKTEPFGVKIYDIYNAFEQRDINNMSRLVGNQALVVFTTDDFHLPIYGDAWGYLVPPLNNATLVWLESSSVDKVFDSGRAYGFYP